MSAPDFCEHTDQVLAELGIGDEQRAVLRTAGAIG
jgi:hypothetical protein